MFGPIARERGFTLIELVVVLFIIGLLSLLSLPFLVRSIGFVSLDASAKDIAAGLRRARALAVAHKGVATFYFYGGRNAFFVVEGYQKITVGKSGDDETIYAEPIESESEAEPDAEETPAETAPEGPADKDSSSGQLIKEIKLVSPDVAVSFVEIYPTPKELEGGDNLLRVVFFPKGNSTGGVFTVSEAEKGDSETSFKIEVDTFTGRVTLRKEGDTEKGSHVI